MSRALVLSGGSIKGAYQAGVVESVVASGFYPDIIVGISTGALTGAFITDRIGRTGNTPPSQADWTGAAEELVTFYKTKITSPSKLIKSKGGLSIGLSVIRTKFDGLVDTSPFRKLLSSQISAANIRKSGIDLQVGAVNLALGDIQYFSALSPSIVDYVVASTAEPIIMPLTEVAGAAFYDGGLVDQAPVGKAIDLGADEIIAVVCQAKRLQAKPFNKRNIFQLVGRVMDTVSAEIVRNDLRQIERINSMLSLLPSTPVGSLLAPYRPIKWKLVQPTDPIDISVDSFTPGDIALMIDLGRDLGRVAMNGPWNIADV